MSAESVSTADCVHMCMQALGVNSNDRSVLKKEVKALRSYADKQKKAMDKKRKEDKKKKR